MKGRMAARRGNRDGDCGDGADGLREVIATLKG